jgi:hypothetical protein
MRKVPVELVSRYEEAGWRTRESRGEVLASGKVQKRLVRQGLGKTLR